MAGIVSRRPVVGVAAGSIIGALGLLLLGIDPTAAGKGLAGMLFKVAGFVLPVRLGHGVPRRLPLLSEQEVFFGRLPGHAGRKAGA